MADWMKDALCAEIGTEMFFPDQGNGLQSRIAKDICRSCPVITDCLEHVLALPQAGGLWPIGVWAGTTERERRTMRKEAS